MMPKYPPGSISSYLSASDYLTVDPITLLDYDPREAFSKGGRLESDMIVLGP
jgi:hypothetical protein